MIGARDPQKLTAIQFQPTLSYEDFVRGWRPDGTRGLQLVDGVFLEAVEMAMSEPDTPFVLVIEEINRGNPAQIFGEMLSLIEDGKRNEAEALRLAYYRLFLTMTRAATCTRQVTLPLGWKSNLGWERGLATSV